MKLYYEKGVKTEKDIEEIQLLDSITYSDKYLISVEDYKKRLQKNSDIIYVVRNSRNNIVGYFSVIPITLEAYEKIKAGGIDKDIINPSNIISKDEIWEYIYWDSIIVDPKYRKFKVGKKLVNFGFSDLLKSKQEIRKIIAHTVSKGGEKLTSMYGLILKKKLDGKSLVVERVFRNRRYNKKGYYSNKNKKAIEKRISRAAVDQNEEMLRDM